MRKKLCSFESGPMRSYIYLCVCPIVLHMHGDCLAYMRRTVVLSHYLCLLLRNPECELLRTALT